MLAAPFMFNQFQGGAVMNSKEMKYLDADYMKQIESLKTEIKHVYFLFFLMAFCFGMLFLIFHLQNKRLVRVEMKVEIHGESMVEKPLTCSI